MTTAAEKLWADVMRLYHSDATTAERERVINEHLAEAHAAGKREGLEEAERAVRAEEEKLHAMGAQHHPDTEQRRTCWDMASGCACATDAVRALAQKP